MREFDDRFGWKKWSFKACAEWLAYRSETSLSAAREKVRTAHALRALPAISAAFAEGRLSYRKVRALTRVAPMHDEDLLLVYALDTTAENVEERCRQVRNVAPESVHHLRRAWQNRSLTAWRDEKRGVLRLTLEAPIDEGELIMGAIDCAVAAGDVTTEIDPSAVAESKSVAWRAQQADALVAVVRSYLDDGHGGEGGSTAEHYQVVVHADAKSLRGGTGCSVSAPLRRALYARDGGCTSPGCRRKEPADTLRFITADGRTIPRHGYRLQDFVDDENPSAEHYCPEMSGNSFNWLRVSAVCGVDSISASS